MKYVKRLATVISLIAVAACNNKDVTPDSLSTVKDVILVATDISTPQTRAGMTTGNITAHNFGLWITPEGETTGSKYIYENKKMDFTQNSGWTAYEWSDQDNASPLSLFWKNKRIPVDVTAVCAGGIQISVTDNKWNSHVASTQDTESSIMENDLLFFKGKVNPTLTANESSDGKISQYALTQDGKIYIPFDHALSKLNITLTLDACLNETPGTETNPVSNLKVNGTNGDFILDISNGTVTKSTLTGFTDPSPVTPWHNAAAYVPGTSTHAVAKYECILVPQTVEADKFSVSFTIDGKEYVWTSAVAVSLKSGKEYTLALMANNITISGLDISATEWGEGTGGSIEIE